MRWPSSGRLRKERRTPSPSAQLTLFLRGQAQNKPLRRFNFRALARWDLSVGCADTSP
nr:MAG TPA: hypothetical protein [Caudoviricetes sp.]